MGKQVEEKVEEIKVDEAQAATQQPETKAEEPKKKGILGRLTTVGKVLAIGAVTAVVTAGVFVVKALTGNHGDETEEDNGSPEESEPTEE